MGQARMVRLVLTLPQAEALLTIANEAEAGAYYEGEMFDRDGRRVRSADLALKKLRQTVQQAQRKEREGK